VDVNIIADWYQVKCNRCGMRGPKCWYEIDAKKSWDSMVRKDGVKGKKYRVAVSGFQEVEAEDSNLAIEKVVQENSLNIESIRVFGVID
jgi:hypothetical protein